NSANRWTFGKGTQLLVSP
uniref:Uncharacterized protein n=1 Tax=Sarcophilus harrisii TaxID=9305 RepID=A0A7N4NQT5_SARHA